MFGKDGSRYFFGQTTESRAELPAGTLVWALDKVEDRNGNYLTVTYVVDEGQVYPSEIMYGGNANVGRSPDRRVVFARTSIYPNYIDTYKSGFRQRTSWILQSIRTFTGTMPAWPYEFVYADSQNSGSKILREVRRLGLDGVTRFPTVRFAYRGSNSAQEASGPIAVPGDWSNEFIRFVVGDFNGDGIQDYPKFVNIPIRCRDHRVEH